MSFTSFVLASLALRFVVATPSGVAPSALPIPVLALRLILCATRFGLLVL